MKSATHVSEPRELNRWGRGKLSPIERTTAFVIAVILKEGERYRIEKKADNYYAVIWGCGMPIRVRLDNKMCEDYLLRKPLDSELNYDDYE